MNAGELVASLSLDDSPFWRDLRAVEAKVKANRPLRLPVEADADGLVAETRRKAKEAGAGAKVKVPLEPDADGLVRETRRKAKEAGAGAKVKVPVAPDLTRFKPEVKAFLAGFTPKEQVKLVADLDRASFARKRAELRRAFEDEGRASSPGFFKRLLTPGQGLVEGLLGPLQTALATPLGKAVAVAIAGGIVQAAALALPAGITLGIGGGLLALGAFALRGSELLKQRFKAASTAISASLARAAKPLEGPFARAIDQATRSIVRMEPQLRGLFRSLAPSIEPFFRGVTGFVQQVLPGLQAAMPAVSAAFATLAERLPGLGATFGQFLGMVTRNKEEIARTIDVVITFTEVLVNGLGRALDFVGKLTRSMADAWAGLRGLLGGGGKGGWETGGGDFDRLAGSVAGVVGPSQKLADAQRKLREQLLAARDAVLGQIPAFEGYKRAHDVTSRGILRNLRQEVAALTSWAANSRRLLARGVDPAVVKALSDKGPQYVAAFVHASDAQLKDLGTLFGKRTVAAGDIAKANLGRKGAEAGRAGARGMEDAFKPKLPAPLPIGSAARGREAGFAAKRGIERAFNPKLKAPPITGGEDLAASKAYQMARAMERNFHPHLVASVTVIGAGKRMLPGYQHGTRFHPGGLAVVGEAGPEVVALPRGASVEPDARKVAAGLAGARAGSGGGSADGTGDGVWAGMLGRLVAAVQDLADRPVTLEVDSREVARASHRGAGRLPRLA